MAIFDLYSKRQKRLKGEIPDVYQYDKIPENLRIQIIHIVRDVIGKNKDHSSYSRPRIGYKFVHDTLIREYGLFKLAPGNDVINYEPDVLNFLLHEKDISKVIDVIELLFRYIDRIIGSEEGKYNEYKHYTDVNMTPQEGIQELNDRFKEHGIGYQFVNGDIIRVDSEYIHSEVVKPLLKLISKRKFQGANEEYMNAHEHYRKGKNKECLNECLKAFESVLKTICKEKGWAFKQSDASKKLINICMQNNLVPSFTQNQFTSLINLLESGIPAIRNKLGGHGQGPVPQKVDDEITRYALNLTASNLVFLIEQSKV